MLLSCAALYGNFATVGKHGRCLRFITVHRSQTDGVATDLANDAIEGGSDKPCGWEDFDPKTLKQGFPVAVLTTRKDM